MYRGDIRLNDTLDFKFTTRSFTTGAPTQLAGTPVISAYPNNSTTQITAGITLTVDFDSVTGLNNVRVVATSGNGYATASNYDLVITTGTVGGVSVVGEVIGSFSIEARSALMPTTAARTLDVSAGGEAGLDWANIGSPTTANNLSGTNIDTDQVVASVTGAVGSVTGAVGSVTGAVGSVTGNVGGNVTGSVGSVTGLTNASIADAVWDEDATAHQTQGTFGQAIGDPGADTDTIWALVNTNLNATVSSRASQTSVDTIDNFLDTEVAAILADTNELQTDWVNGGRLDLLIDAIKAKTDNLPAAPAATGDIPTAAAIADAVWDEAQADHVAAGSFGITASEIADILVDTAVIGAAGAGLTAIPWNAAWDAEVQSEVADGLTAYGAATATDVTTAAANVSVDEIQVTALADLFNTNSGTTYASAVAGSVVKEIADNAGGSALTEAGIADAVWDELLSGHAISGSAGEALSAAGTAGDPWTTALPGAYGAGTAGNIIGNNLNATVSSRASQTSVDTIDGIVDSILVDTAEIGAAGAGLTALASQASVNTIDDFLDTEIAAILADTNELQTDWANGGRLDLILDARASQTSVDTIDGIVDNILLDTAEIGAAGAGLTAINLPDQTMNITGNITGNLSGSVGSVTGAVGSVTGAVGSVTGLTNATIADAVWDEALSGHAAAGSTGEALTTASTAAGLDAAGVRAAVGLASANLDTQLGDLPTAVENADALLGRNVSGGSSAGRTVKQALHVLRNKTEIAGGTLTVYDTDDSTASFTAAVTTTAGDPVSSIDPA